MPPVLDPNVQLLIQLGALGLCGILVRHIITKEAKATDDANVREKRLTDDAITREKRLIDALEKMSESGNKSVEAITRHSNLIEHMSKQLQTALHMFINKKFEVKKSDSSNELDATGGE